MHLAQLNIAKAKYALDAIEIKEFVDNLEPVNLLAEKSEGFIWRLYPLPFKELDFSGN